MTKGAVFSQTRSCLQREGARVEASPGLVETVWLDWAPASPPEKQVSAAAFNS